MFGHHLFQTHLVVQAGETNYFKWVWTFWKKEQWQQ